MPDETTQTVEKRGPGRPRKEPVAPAVEDTTPPPPPSEIPNKPQPRVKLRNTNPAAAPDTKALPPETWDIGIRAPKHAPVEDVEDSETPVSTPEQTAKIEVNADAVDDDLLEQAVASGIKLAQARKMGGEALRIVLETIKSKAAPAEPATADKPGNQTVNPFFDAIPEYATSLDDKLVDESIVKDVKGLANHTNTYFKAVQSGFHALRNDVTTELVLAKVEQFDDMVERLGREWEPTFGKGENSDLNPNSQEFHARARLFDAMQKIRDESRRKGEVISSKKAFRKALGQEFAEQAEQAKAAAKEDATRNKKGQFLSRPTNRETTPDATAKERAEAHAAAYLKQHGIPVRSNGSRRIF